jgi:hypothetical protein
VCRVGGTEPAPRKKGIGLLCPRTEMSFQLIRHLQKEAIPVQQSCRVLAVCEWASKSA